MTSKRRRELKVVVKYGELMTEAEFDAWLERYARLVIDAYRREQQASARLLPSDDIAPRSP